MKEKILVVGGTGFIGTHIIKLTKNKIRNYQKNYENSNFSWR